ncbi:nonstructural protein [Blackfly microvirus SF02]|uniref:Nonstructural protein n=1 Tax=Blackfly microvirus SF02 TaxID=2576452 RepID=A0A4P8PT53_9VIRU|nr:nonstructural protein [Blackfly microvirus SF02]
MVYSVHDKAAGAFLPPFFQRAKGEAIRAFEAAVKDPAHQFHQHATDYVMYELGSFDDQTGLLDTAEPLRVISGIEINPLSV